MSRSNHDKPFYVDVGTSIVAVRCASNHDVVLQYDHSWRPSSIELARTACDRMNKEAEISSPRRNCDVGTVEEQFARFRKFCKKDSMDSFESTAYCAYECPCGNNYDCKLAWAQMPYEEGGVK